MPVWTAHVFANFQTNQIEKGGRPGLRHGPSDWTTTASLPTHSPLFPNSPNSHFFPKMWVEIQLLQNPTENLFAVHEHLASVVIPNDKPVAFLLGEKLHAATDSASGLSGQNLRRGKEHSISPRRADPRDPQRADTRLRRHQLDRFC